jgi:predicted nucleic acid-binding protein
MFLQLADITKARSIITLDKDLLVLKKYKETHIVRPHDFIKIMHGDSKTSGPGNPHDV